MPKINPGLGDKTGHYQAITQILSVTSWNGLTGDVAADVVSSLNGATGDLTALTSFNDNPGPTIYYTYVPPIGLLAESVVSSWNGITGDVSFTQYVSDIADATGSITSFDGGTFS